MSKSTALSARQQFWVDHLRRCEQLGQSLSAYAAEQGLNLGALYEAKSRLKRMGVLPVRTEPARFVRVSVSAAPTAALCRVLLPNGVVVDTAGAELSAVLSAAARLP